MKIVIKDTESVRKDILKRGMNTDRNYIGFELGKEYYEVASKRISKHVEDITQIL